MEDSHISILFAISASGSIITGILFSYSLYVVDTRQRLAYQGDQEAAHKLILPCYRPLYIGLIIYFVVLSAAQLLTLTEHDLPVSTVVFILQFHSLCLLASFLICPLLFIQHSISIKGFITTALLLLPWFLICICCLVAVFYQKQWVLAAQIIFLLLTFIPGFIFSVGILSRFIVTRIRLGSRSNRNSVEHLLVFVLIFLSLNIIDIVNPDDDTLFKLLLAYVIVTFFWNILFALSIHRSLLADTKFWRGLGTHNRGYYLILF